MRENERKCKRAGTVERFPPRNFIHRQKGLLTVSCLGSFIDNTQYKITKISKQALLQWSKIGKKTKKRTKSEKVKQGAGIQQCRNLNSGRKGNFVGCEIVAALFLLLSASGF